MNVFVSRDSRADRRSDDSRRRFIRNVGRAVAAGVVAAFIAATGTFSGPARTARADDQDSKDGPLARPEFVRQIQRTLKDYDDRLVVLGKRLLEEPGSSENLGDQIVNQRISVKVAESNYLNAKLTREVAEIAVKEYTLGIFVQDLQTVEGELQLARSDLERGKDRIEVAKERQARIKEVADENTASGRMANYMYEDQVASATLELEKRKYALEVAESKKKILLEYTKEKRIKELESEVKKAHSEELAKQATWELEKGKLEYFQRALKTAWPASNVGKRLVTLLDRAMPIEERLQSKLEAFRNSAKSEEPLQKEIRDLTNQLGAIIDEAEAAKAADDFARLRSRIQGASRR